MKREIVDSAVAYSWVPQTFLSRQAFSDESHSFTHNEFHVRSQGPQ